MSSPNLIPPVHDILMVDEQTFLFNVIRDELIAKVREHQPSGTPQSMYNEALRGACKYYALLYEQLAIYAPRAPVAAWQYIASARIRMCQDMKREFLGPDLNATVVADLEAYDVQTFIENQKQSLCVETATSSAETPADSQPATVETLTIE